MCRSHPYRVDCRSVRRSTMSLIARVRRLWELSAQEGEFISREDADALVAHLKELEVEIEDMNHRVSDWIGVLMKSELLRRELEKRDHATDLGAVGKL